MAGRLANAFLGSRTALLRRRPSPPTGCSRRWRAGPIVRALNASGASVSFVEIETDQGHDAFLLDEPVLFASIRGFLTSAAAALWT